MKRYLVALASIALLAGCGGGDPAASTPDTPALSSTPTVSVTPSRPPTPKVLTREQAAKRYLEIVKPFNDQLADSKCQAADDYIVNGGSWPPDGHPDWERAEKVAQGCFKKLVPLLERQIRDLQSTRWPTDAKSDVADLVSLSQGILHCDRQGAKADTTQEMDAVYACFPEDDGSADRVRARFGLPTRSP